VAPARRAKRHGPFVDVRFHGATGKYGGSNDVGGHAPRHALTLRRILEEG
jgi:hypothetical protein